MKAVQIQCMWALIEVSHNGLRKYNCIFQMEDFLQSISTGVFVQYILMYLYFRRKISNSLYSLRVFAEYIQIYLYFRRKVSHNLYSQGSLWDIFKYIYISEGRFPTIYIHRGLCGISLKVQCLYIGKCFFCGKTC